MRLPSALSGIGAAAPAQLSATLPAVASALLSVAVLTARMTAWVMAGAAVAVVLAALAAMAADPKSAVAVRAALADLANYYRCFVFFARGGSYDDCPYFRDRRQARLQLYSLVLIFTLWDRPHYRNGTFQHDMVKNLRNVAIPGTGVPLSVFCRWRWSAYFLLLVLTPVVCLVAAIKAAATPAELGGVAAPAGTGFVARAAGAFREQLLCPQDWFSFWRLNCRLATWHSSVCTPAAKKGYALEDKWLFLAEAEAKGVPVSPSLQLPGIVVKHRNEEGGMGFQSFRNAAAGGDWCIQAKLANSPFLCSLLPENAPLSTFRVITSSTGGMPGRDGPPAVNALSCVWRAGRAGAATDHQSILFDVDMATGEIKRGTTSAHWYRLGLAKALRTPWLSTHDVETHPDTQRRLVGKVVPNMPEIVRLVNDAHLKLCPTVPLVGWDVALTKDNGTLLLEGNFSCNFFRGHFDQQKYFSFVEEFFRSLEGVECAAATSQ